MIIDIVIDTFLSAKERINPSNGRKSNFELMGYDFMIDEDLRVWLIEININPYLGMPNQYIKVLLPSMLDELLRIVVDPHYPPSNEYQKSVQGLP